MTKPLPAICNILFGVLVCNDAGALYIDINKCGDEYALYDDTIVADNGLLSFYDIYIRQSIVMQNMGAVYGDIHLCDGCFAYVRNSGDIIGRFLLGSGSILTQVIEHESDITKLDVNAGYNILVRGMDNVSLPDVIDVGTFIDKIIIENSSLTFTPDLAAMPNIEFIGTNFIILSESDATDGMRLLSNIMGDGMIYAYISNSDNDLYAAATYISDGDVYLHLVRSIDYERILSTDIGAYLNTLRAINPESKLLRALDSASDVAHMAQIMNESIRFNHSILMRPIHAFEMLTDTHATDAIPGRATAFAGPMMVYSDDAVIYGTRVAISMPIGVASQVTATVYTGLIDGADSFDEYSGAFYGGHIAFDYHRKMLRLHGLIGGTVAEFDTPGLFDTVQPRYEITGTSIYSNFNAGVRLALHPDVNIVPLIGIRGHYTATESGRATMNKTAYLGSTAEYTDDSDNGIVYKYSATVSGSQNGEICAELNAAAYSVVDMIGANIGVGVFHNEFATSYKISVGAKFIF